MSFWERNKIWISLVATIYLVALVVGLVTDASWAVKFLAYMSIIMLAFTLAPARLIRWFSKTPSSYLTTLLAYRRSLGVTTGFSVLGHVFLAFLAYGDLDITFYFSQPILPGALAEFVFVLMLVTSGTYLTGKLGKYWKPLHRLVWLTIPLIYVHALVANPAYDPFVHTHEPAMYMLIGIGLLAVVDLVQALVTKRSAKVAVITLVILVAGTLVAIVL